ncbi:unnamed protein product [Rotaria socialis]|uniref:ILEI/PANDER domain-containing protein n=1 Tax=Rotaria socialis TaxID=392032 RepID=A0A820PTR3_9BILA|nr:unnamed protein product [Rotaria socialis]CAF4413583.1 unnamed protein product [Rotaria socialis]
MRRFKRIIQKQFGGLGNFLAMIILVSITVIFINTYVLSKRNFSLVSDNLLDRNFRKGEQIYNQNQTKLFFSQSLVQRSLLPDLGCEIDDKCSDDTIPYKAISGEGTDKYPIICFNNKLLIHKTLKDTKIGRGLNVAVVDSKTYDVKFIENFDTYLEETFFLRFLRLKLNDGDIVIIASHDEMTYGLRDASLALLENYGSQTIRAVKYRDSYVMIGQKGLARGHAIEMHQSKGRSDFGSAAQISGCGKFPLGQITPLSFPIMEVNKEGKIAVGATIKNCGLTATCKENEFAVHVYTGKDNKDEPKICVDGKYVIAKGINDAGRGLNVVVVSNGKEVIRTGHFDTWKEDSTNLEIFLENLEDNVIIIVVSFDEASLKLSQHSKTLFFDLGSATIQNLKYRDVWVFVGQKGIKGFSPYEEISYAGFGSTYASLIDKRMCVPQTLKGVPIRPDPLPYRNDKRREFCSHYDGYGDFCSDTNVDKNLVPIPLINKTLEDNPIYSTPILVIAGISHNSLRMCLETLLMQPGINIENVIVTVDEKFSEPLTLIHLFGFRGGKTSNSSTYMEHYEKSLKKIWEIYPNQDKVIVIEEDLILSPDFLYTLALLSETFRKDETIGAIEMWNPNSYDIVNGSEELIYRVDQFYGLGYLLKRSFYEKNMKNSFDICCSKRVWEKWAFSDPSSFLMPDVSRVFRRPIDGNRVNKKYIETLFNRKRKTSLNPFPFLSNIDILRKDKYDANLAKSISSAVLMKSLNKCVTTNNSVLNLIQIQNSNNNTDSFKYVYPQESLNDVQYLLSVLSCFALFPYEPIGLYNGILRFNSNQYNFYLVGSKSSVYTNVSKST